jgi:hypothetical protein
LRACSAPCEPPARSDPPAPFHLRIRAKFIAYALPADFVEDLRADRDAIDDSNSANHDDNFAGVESTKAIDLVLGQIQSVVTRLDALMQNLYRRTPEKLCAWQSACHVERAPKKQKPDEDTTPPPVAWSRKERGHSCPCFPFYPGACLRIPASTPRYPAWHVPGIIPTPNHRIGAPGPEKSLSIKEFQPSLANRIG